MKLAICARVAPALLLPSVVAASPVSGGPPTPHPDLFWWIEVLSAGLWIVAVTILVYCIYDGRRPDEAVAPAEDRPPAAAVRPRRQPVAVVPWRPRLTWPRWLARSHG